VLYINPGSAGPRRFSLPVSVGRLAVAGALVTPRLLELKPEASTSSTRNCIRCKRPG